MSFPLKFVKKNYVSNTNQGKWRVCGDERSNVGILDKTLTSGTACSAFNFKFIENRSKPWEKIFSQSQNRRSANAT